MYGDLEPSHPQMTHCPEMNSCGHLGVPYRTWAHSGQREAMLEAAVTYGLLHSSQLFKDLSIAA